MRLLCLITATLMLCLALRLERAHATPERLFVPIGVEVTLLEDLSHLIEEVKANAHLELLYKLTPPLSLGRPNKGRLLFAHRMRSALGLKVMESEDSYTTFEAALTLYAINSFVRRLYPDGPDMMVLDISQDGGGRFKPHKTHQNGADVDLRYYLKGTPPNDHEKRYVHPSKLDLKRTWAFLKVIDHYQLAEVLFMDLSLQKVLYQYGLDELNMSKGELKRFLSYPERSRGGALVKHVNNHYHHLHIRLNLEGAQPWWDLSLNEADELHQRYLQSRTGFFEHIVQSGETLGAIAAFNRVRLRDLLKWNQMDRSSVIRPGQVLKVWR